MIEIKGASNSERRKHGSIVVLTRPSCINALISRSLLDIFVSSPAPQRGYSFLTQALFFFFFFFFSRGISTVIAVVHYPESLMIYLLFRFPRKLCGKRKRETEQKYGTCISTRGRICRRRKSRKEVRVMRYWLAYFMFSSTFILNRSINPLGS